VIPAHYDLGFQIGATFEARVLLALDANLDPVDLEGYIPYATAKDVAGDAVIVDLQPTLISPGTIGGPVTFDVGGSVFTSAGHGLLPGLNISFTSTGSLPVPLRASERYIVLAKNLTLDTFEVVSFHAAWNGFDAPLRIRTSGSGTLTIALVPGQILLPEITDEDTEQYTEHDASWDLMLEDSAGRRLAPVMRGKFPIKYGFTDPVIPP
jgi:hypothetical protein